MGILQQSTLRVTMEAVRVLMTAALLGGAQCRPQQLTQEVLLTPFNFVRSTGNTALTTGQQVIQSVPEAVNVVSDTAVTGVNVVPQTISTVSDFTVDSINAVPETINTVTGTAFRTGEALVNGGTRLALATGGSLFRTGLNTIGGGGRILFATAGVPFSLAGSAAQRLRDMF